MVHSCKKSKIPNNVEADFEEFKNNKVMAEVFRRIEITDRKVTSTELGPLASRLLSEIYPQENMLERTKREYEEAQQELSRLKQELTHTQQDILRYNQGALFYKERADKAEKEKQESCLKAVHGFLSLGKDIPDIAGILDLSIEETYSLAQQIPHK
jgi:phage shock protein A